MKRTVLTVVLGLATLTSARAQTLSAYTNNGIVSSPINIDAFNFINNGTFSPGGFGLYDGFSNVRNFTNRNTMSAGGFIFDTAPTSVGSRRPARYFVNAPLIPNIGNASVSGSTHLLIHATNVINRGNLSIGRNGLLQVQGGNLDMSRGVFQVGSLGDRTPDQAEEIYDSYWQFATNQFVPAAALTSQSAITPPHTVTNFFPQSAFNPYFQSSTILALIGAGVSSAEFISPIVGSNGTVQVVFLRNTNSALTTEIRTFGNTAFDPGIADISWSTLATNAFGQVYTNSMFLTDTYGSNPTNVFITNFPFATPQSAGLRIPPETYQPENFSVTRTTPFSYTLGLPGPPFTTKPAAFWGTNPIVNVRFSAYSVDIANTPPSANVITNARISPGRVEITGNQFLDMNLTRLQGLNYVSMSGTNHFNGATNGSISTVYADIALGSTNGTLTAAGLLNPVVPQFSGTISCYSAVWSNTVVQSGATNLISFHVLIVDSDLHTTIEPVVFDLGLRSTNLFIGDTYRVVNKLELNTERLTVLTNGFLDILNSDINWLDSAPNIVSLTNLGTIGSVNAAYFVGGNGRPYSHFVNRGEIFTAGNIIYSDYVENDGDLFSFDGPVYIESGGEVVLRPNALTFSSFSDIAIVCQNLSVTNHFLDPARSLSLMVSGALNTGANAWTVFDGFNLLTLPASGDLQSTIVTNLAAPFENVFNYWAGENRGVSPTGFTNNGALGWLILDGENFASRFTYSGTDADNGLYVDRIDFQGFATNRNTVTSNMTALQIDSNLVIYYAKAIINGTDVSAQLDGYNGGRLRWVSAMSSQFSASQVVVVGSAAASVNLDLVQQALAGAGGNNAASSGSGFNTSSIGLSVAIANVPNPAALVSWNCVPNSVNSLYYKDGVGGSWQLLTNVVSGRICRKITAVDPASATGRFYKVQVSVPNQ